MNDQPSPVPPAAPASQPSKTSGLAIASLVLGILGITCVLPGIGAILALIFGIVAMVKISNSGGNLRGQGQAIAGLVLGGVGLLVIPIMAAMLLPALSQAREAARRAQCLSNMKQLALACQLYATEHEGQCPRKLDDLRKYVGSAAVFHCPSAPDSSTSSYEIVYQGKLPAEGPGVPILHEDPSDHRGVGGNVAYADGHVAWVTVHSRPLRD